MHYVIRLVNPGPERASRADVATTVALVGRAVQGDTTPGDYLEWSDPDANKGKGAERWTSDPAKAKRFATFVEAAECWKAQSKLRPFRPDGKPNRPMTAYSVTIEKVTA